MGEKKDNIEIMLVLEGRATTSMISIIGHEFY
jgi:hypothetical protein